MCSIPPSSNFPLSVRPLSYPDTHVTVISFAIDSPASLFNVYDKVRKVIISDSIQLSVRIFRLQILARFIRNDQFYPCEPDTNTGQWLAEIAHYNDSGSPFILAGLKPDLRNDKRSIEELAKCGESSPLRRRAGNSKKDRSSRLRGVFGKDSGRPERCL